MIPLKFARKEQHEFLCRSGRYQILCFLLVYGYDLLDVYARLKTDQDSVAVDDLSYQLQLMLEVNVTLYLCHWLNSNNTCQPKFYLFSYTLFFFLGK